MTPSPVLCFKPSACYLDSPRVPINLKIDLIDQRSGFSIAVMLTLFQTDGMLSNDRHGHAIPNALSASTSEQTECV